LKVARVGKQQLDVERHKDKVQNQEDDGLGGIETGNLNDFVEIDDKREAIRSSYNANKNWISVVRI